MTSWTSLRDAYGTAGPVEALLRRGDTQDRTIWDELWSRLCHQGTVYSASYAALPRLADLAARQDPSGFVEPLFLATCIVASTDGPEEPAAVRTRYADTIRTLREVAEGLVPLAADDTDFIYRAQAVLATESGSVWATRLDALADQELEFACPGCDEQLVIGFETSAAHVKQFGDGSVGQTTVAPCDPGQLTGSEARAYDLATTHRRPQVAKQLLDLFGIFQCPVCHSTGRTSAALG
ncbi:hypothetical protein E1218_03075 [Kribbella turkmenica]|uniref:Uncharacterized protein n=1 Tax=Kribbella turkmenica TaxID=2530375 RepID=A0A4R4XG33_9ACTN|nr:hypothetical protein [Kribbella turkmenica]TDD29763.1 hypothetical protein E1218_03075 [Kribbella turkmenica]